MTASYPTSVKSFTTKVDFTDTVLAAHVNSLQEEVVALQSEIGTDITIGSGWVGAVDFVTSDWNTLKDRIANIEYGLKDVYDDYVSLTGGSVVVSGANSTVSLTLKAKSGQTANLLELKNSSNTVVSSVNASGNIYTYSQQVVPIVYSASQPSSVPAGTIWVDSSSSVAILNSQSGVPSGGTTGQALIKNSSTNYDISWGSVSISSGVSGLGSNVATFLATPSSANLISAITDETGSGSLVFATSPSLTTPTIGGGGANFNGSSSGTTNVRASAAAGSTTITLPATTGTVVTTGDSGTVTSTMIAEGTIVNGDISASAAIAVSKLASSSVTVNGTAISLGSSGTVTVPISTGVSGLGTGVATFLATPSSANLISAITDETGSGALVFATSPSLTTPTIGGGGANFSGSTSGTTNLKASAAAGATTITLPATTGTVITTGDSGTVTNTMLAGSIAASKVTGTAITAADTGTVTNTMLAGSIANSKLTNSSVTVNGTAISLGSSGTVTVPISTGVSGLGTGVATFLATPSSANLASAVTDETGSGALVFGTSPTIATPVITLGKVTPTFSTNNYDLVLTDQYKFVLASNGATAGTVSIPTNSVAYPVGTQITIVQTGTGQITITAKTPATTTINSTGSTAASPKLRAQYSSATCLKTDTETWLVVGDIS